MRKKKYTLEQEEFIRANRFDMTMKEMSLHLGIGYNRVRNYMIDNHLSLTRDEISAITLRRKARTPNKAHFIKTFNHPKWVPNPWDLNLNLATMQTGQPLNL